MENDKSFSTNYFTHDNSKDNYRAIEFSVFYLIEAADSKRNLISKLLQINDFRFIYMNQCVYFSCILTLKLLSTNAKVYK